MNKLRDALREVCNNKSIEITSKIDFEYDDKSKTIHMNMKDGIHQNMQKDAAAFEGWALGIKANLDNLVDYVVLDWETDNEPKKNDTEGWRHYNRFIYRVDAFREKYSEWFLVPNQKDVWKNQMKVNQWDHLVLNSPGNRFVADDIYKVDATNEHDLERYFIASEGSDMLGKAVKEQFNIKLGPIKNQYPVGIFNNEVTAKTYVFTGGKSAIDLYSIGEDNSFNIFELKAGKNVKIGILSELFFYSCLIGDAISGKFKSESKELESLNKVNAFFLVSRIHPLITNKVIDMLNMPNSNISYRKLIYEVSNVKFLVK